MSNRAGSSRRRIRTPTPLIYLLLITRLSTSSFLASAQYVHPEEDPTGWASRRSHPHANGSVDGNAKRDQSSTSRSIYINGYDDFCLFGPPNPFNYIWSSGLNVVSWCSKAGHDTRLIPDGTIHGVSYVRTKDWVQVSGFGDFTKINIAPGDVGGQFDSATHLPEGATVSVSGQNAGSWVTLISSDTFCMRACTGDSAFCPSTYDQMGCWFLTGNAVGPSGTFQGCEADSGEPPGVVGGKTFVQGSGPAPDPTSPDLRNCQPGQSIANGQAAPPMYTWNGEPGDPAVVVGAGGGGGAGGAGGANSGGAAPSGGGQIQASTTWVPVETCQPCNQQPNSAPAPAPTPAPTGGTTQQVGVTQISPVPSGAGALFLYAGGASGPASGTPAGGAKTATQAPAPGNDELSRRQDHDENDGAGGKDAEETVTKNGQCCHTTYTPSTIGGGGAGSGPSATAKASGSLAGGAGSKTVSGLSMSGTMTLGGSTTHGIVPSGPVNASGSLGLNGNGTGGNGTGNGSAAGLRMEVWGVQGFWRAVGGWGVGLVGAAMFGGWMLV